MSGHELFRPVGLYELRLIRESGYRAFPPRLSHQPIFYPVLDVDYAIQIARDWNTKDPNSGYMGVVTAFGVDEDYLARFAVQVVGTSKHRELWIPAESLDEFNRHLVGQIRIIAAFYGALYADERDW
jgi:hypothetical protein